MRSTDYVSPDELKAFGREPREALVPGFPGYLVDELGRVWSCRGQWFNPGGTRNWRPHSISISGKYYVTTLFTDDGKPHVIRVRKLVAIAFLGPKPPGWKLISKDRDTTNHRLSNLEYRERRPVSPALARWSGQHKKVTEAQVIALRRRAHAGERPAALADEFGLERSYIRQLLVGRTWPHVDAGVPPWTPDRVKRTPRSPLTPEQEADIAEQVRHGRSSRAIWLERFQGVCSYQRVHKIALSITGPQRIYGRPDLRQARHAAAKKRRRQLQRERARDGTQPLDARSGEGRPEQVVGPTG